MNDAKNNLLNGEKMIKAIQKYYSNIESLISNTVADEYRKSVSLLNTLSKLSSKLNGMYDEINTILDNPRPFEKTAYTYITTYHQIQNYYAVIDDVFSGLSKSSNPVELSVTDVSQTHQLEIEAEYEEVLLKYKAFVKTAASIITGASYMLSNHLLDIFIKENNIHQQIHPKTVIQSIKYLHDLYAKYPNTLSIYAKFMDDLLNAVYSKGPPGKDVATYITTQIEYDKNAALAEQAGKATVYKNTRAIKNPPLKGFGLLPVTDNMELPKLILKIIGKKTTIKDHCNKNNVGFIIITRIGYNPVKYDVNSLLYRDRNIPPVPATFGITNETVSRFNNIEELDKSKYKFEYKVINKKPDIKYYIIETIDGRTYRALYTWGGNIHNYSVPYTIAEPILRFIDNQNKPSRVTNYHRIAINKAVKNMFLPRELSLAALESASKEIDTHLMRNRLFLSISTLMHDIVKKSYGNGKKIVGNVEMNEIIHDERINETFYGIILNLYNVGTKLIFEQMTSKFPTSEIMASYLKELVEISRQFMKELHNGYNREPLASGVFKSADKRTAIIDKLDDVLNKVINTIISNKSNIYVALNYKYLILNFE